MNGPIQWREALKSHYPTIDDFDDAPTVRIMIRMATEWLETYQRDLDTITKESERQYWIALFKEDHDGHTAVKAELEGWLERRGLTL